MILLSAVTIPRACFDPTSGYKPTLVAQNTDRSLRYQKLNIILTWDTKKRIFSVLGGSRDCHYSLQLSREATPLENPFRTGDFPVTPLCPCSLTPKKLLQKPQRYFFYVGTVCGFNVVGHATVIV